MCLQSSYTGDELYMLEFFLCESDENDENILTKLRLILGTMEEYFETFKLASGQELGEVEVIDFPNDQRSHSIQTIPATRSIPGLELLKDGGVMLHQGQLDQPSMNVVTAERNILVASSSKEGKRKMQDREHKKAGVRIEVSLEEILKCSNMKRNSAARKLKGSVANIKTGFQGADMVTIRAKWEKYTIKFCLSLLSRLVELQQEVAKRLNLRAETYHITYKDEKDELILITLDEDLQARGQQEQDSSFIHLQRIEFKMMMMPIPIHIHGSVDDAHTILLGVEEDYFTRDFKEYLLKERLYWSRIDGNPDWKGRPSIGWVFWSQLGKSSLSFSLAFFFLLLFLGAQPLFSFTEHFEDLIRQAIQKLIGSFNKHLDCSLVQFWAPTKTSEGRTLLTTQFHPFALGPIYAADWRKSLCEYRMGMCREYNNSFYTDAECAQELLGLPGRVFLNKLPESTPKVKHYTLKEYPQRDLALRCGIKSSWALPVFDHSGHTCVGVLEIVSLSSVNYHGKEFLGRMYDNFQEFGLLCFNGYEHCKMQLKQYWDKNEALTAAFQELKMVYESVGKIHNLPLALAWVSCHSCNDLLQSQFQLCILDYSTDEDDYDDDYCLLDFTNVIKACLLKKGQVTGRILPFPNLLYCSDVKQLSIAEFPLVPYARWCKLGGWFTMCLQSGYARDELYVLEFFLPKSYKNNEYILTKLRLILGPMEEYFKTFKLASGQGLGEALSVEVIDFQNGQKSHSIQIIPATRCVPGLEPLHDGGVMTQLGQVEQPSMDVINSGMYVVSETQNYNLPILDSLQNGKVTTQVDSSDQQSMNPSNKGENAVTAERNILGVSSSKKGKRMMQDRKHNKAGVRIEVSLEEILKCSNMKRKYAARELKALSFPSFLIQVWLDAHFSYTPTIDEEETINK
ncbi:hypothetical protein RHGRI_006042 [Rhododendron griersonianum]|uniref:PB1 domain-containing protein n=1 Tax=Rhododendron griersonianum TaxID=479676 RepID=A0AAV6LFM6_9ERIC|nr:hypothetical protein RHGRI_006042 [Rhododendron griersonianum]